MKKLISLLLALALALSVISCGLAEGADDATGHEETAQDEAANFDNNTDSNEEAGDGETVPFAYWETVASDVEALGLKGDFCTVDGLGVAFWLPAFLVPDNSGLTYEETNALAAFHTEDDAKSFLVTYYPLDVENIIAFAAMMDELGAQEGKFAIINDLPAYSFVYDDMFHVSFCAEGGYILSFDFGPASNLVFRAVANIIAASIQETEEE